MGVPHFGQRDPGKMMEISSGIRVMQTFRKLPMTAPNKKKNMMAITTVSVDRLTVAREVGRSQPLFLLSHSHLTLSTNHFLGVPHL